MLERHGRLHASRHELELELELNLVRLKKQKKQLNFVCCDATYMESKVRSVWIGAAGTGIVQLLEVMRNVHGYFPYPCLSSARGPYKARNTPTEISYMAYVDGRASPPHPQKTGRQGSWCLLAMLILFNWRIFQISELSLHHHAEKYNR